MAVYDVKNIMINRGTQTPLEWASRFIDPLPYEITIPVKDFKGIPGTIYPDYPYERELYTLWEFEYVADEEPKKSKSARFLLDTFISPPPTKVTDQSKVKACKEIVNTICVGHENPLRQRKPRRMKRFVERVMKFFRRK